MTSNRLPSPAMLVAVIALVAALAGSALALPGSNSVKSNDIKRDAVKGTDIATGAVKPVDLDLIKVDGEVGPLPTASVPAIDLGGPSVTISVPETGLVAIYARGTGQINGGGNDALAQIHLFEPTAAPERAADPGVQLEPAGAADLDPRHRQPRRHAVADARRLDRVPRRQGQVHVLALLQRRGRWHRHLLEHRPVGRGDRLDRGTLDGSARQLGIERIALHQGARPLPQRLAL